MKFLVEVDFPDRSEGKLGSMFVDVYRDLRGGYVTWHVDYNILGPVSNWHASLNKQIEQRLTAYEIRRNKFVDQEIGR